MSSGAGGYTFQRSDYHKHNQIYKDLVKRDWPVIYNEKKGRETFLCYNLAYYLSPAYLTKICGSSFDKGWISKINLFSFCNTFLGVFIFFCWLYVLSKKKRILIIFIVVLIGGLDAILFLINFLKTNDISHLINSHEQIFLINNYYIHHPGIIEHLLWAPQHCLPGWIITSLLLFYMNKKNIANVLFIHSLSIFWSVFIFLGLIPITIFVIVKYYNKSLFTFQNIVGGIFIALLFTIYYQAHEKLEFLNVIFIPHTGLKDIIYWLYFMMTEFFVFFFFTHYYKQNIPLLKIESSLLNICLYSLIFISIFIIGRFNDLVLRATIPASFILYFFFAQVIVEYRQIPLNLNRYILCILLVFIFFVPSKEIYKSIHFSYFKRDQKEVTSPSQILQSGDYYTMENFDKYYIKRLNDMPDFKISSQYLGTQKSIFYNYLIKK